MTVHPSREEAGSRVEPGETGRRDARLLVQPERHCRQHRLPIARRVACEGGVHVVEGAAGGGAVAGEQGVVGGVVG